MGSPFLDYLGRSQGDSLRLGTVPSLPDLPPLPGEETEEERMRRLSAELGNVTPFSMPDPPSQAAMLRRQGEQEETRGPLRQMWETGTAPIKAAVGLTGTAAVQGLGLRHIFPNAYRSAVDELTQEVTGGEDRELSTLEKAQTLPGVGDMIAQSIDPAGKVGRFTRTPVRIAGNVLGDPSSYIGEGLIARLVSPVSRAGAALGRVQNAIRAAEASGDTAKVTELTALLPQLAGRLAEVAGGESNVGRAARTVAEAAEGLGRVGATGEAVRSLREAPSFGKALGAASRIGLTLPVGPVAGLAYLPEMVEGVAGGLKQAADAFGEGRYGDAAASAGGSMLSAGLARLVARGVMTEARAAKVMERSMAPPPRPGALRGAEESGMPVSQDPESVPVEPDAPPTAPPPQAPAVPPAVAPGAPGPESAPLNQQTTQPQAPAAATAREPHPRSASLQVDVSDATTSKINDIMRLAAEKGGMVSKADLVKAGVLTERQARDRGLQEILDRFDVGLFDRLEPVPGRGYRVRVESAPTAPAGPGGAAPLKADEATPPTEEPAASPPAATAVAQPGLEEGATVPQEAPAGKKERVARAEIQRQLDETPGLRAFAEATLKNVARARKKDVAALDIKEDIAAVFPGETEGATRALLRHVLAQQRAAAKRTPSADGDVQASFSDPDALAAAMARRQRLQQLIADRPPRGEAMEYEAQLAALNKEIVDTYAKGLYRAPDPQRVPPYQHEPVREVEEEPIRPELVDLQMPVRRDGKADPNATLTVPARQFPSGTSRLEPDRDVPADEDSGEALTLLMRVKAISDDYGIPLDTTLKKGEELVGKPLDDMSGDDLNYIFTTMDRNPHLFGVPEKERMIPEIHEPAVRRLVGDTNAISKRRERLNREGVKTGNDSKLDFEYDRESPAGRVQSQARASQAVDQESRLQETIIKRLSELSDDDSRFVRRAAAEIMAVMMKRQQEISSLIASGKTAEAEKVQDALNEWVMKKSDRAMRRTSNAQNWRRLLVEEPDEGVARKELERLLGMDLKRNRQTAFKVRDGKAVAAAARAVPIEAAARMASVADVDLTPAERSRMSQSDIRLLEPEEGDTSPHQFDVPEKIDGEAPAAYLARIQDNPDLKRRMASSIIALARQWRDTSAANKGTTNEAMNTAKKIAADVGMEVSSKRSGERLFYALARFIGGQDVRASVAEPLTAAEVSAKRSDYLAKVSRAALVGDTGAVAVDLNGGASQFVKPLSLHAAPVADTLARLTSDISSALDMPTRFGGFTVDHAYNAIRIDDAAFVNPFNARTRAQDLISGRGLQDDAYTEALNYETARTMIDELLHEIAHVKARHDAATGDIDFITAYAQAVKDAAPHYMDSVREIWERLTPVAKELDRVMPSYRASLSGWKEALRGGVGREGNLPGAGARRIAPIQDRRGGDPGGAAGSSGSGVQPSGAVRGSEVQPSGRVGEGAAAVEGAAAEGTGRSGRGVNASFISDAADALRRRRGEEAARRFTRVYAESVAKYSGKPDTADDILKQYEAIATLPAEAREQLRQAGPQRSIDIGLNLGRMGADAMSDEQREVVGAILAVRNNEFSRSEPMTEKQVRSAMSDILERHTPEEFVALAKKRGLNRPEDFAAMRAIVATMAKGEDDARAALRSAEIAGNQEGIELAKADLVSNNARKMSAIWAMIGGSPKDLGTTNAARNLAFMRIIAHPMTKGEEVKSRVLGAMRASGIKKERAEQLYQIFADTAAQGASANWQRFQNALSDATNPSMGRKFLEFWKAGLLGWPTQIANVVSNVGFRALRDVEHAVGVLANIGHARLTGKQQTRHLQEISGRIFATRLAVREAWDMLKGDLADIFTLKPPDMSRRFAHGTIYDDPEIHRLTGAIGGTTGEAIRIPFKLLDVADNFFKHISRSQEYAAQAVRLAHVLENRTQGESVQHAINRIHNEIRSAASDPLGRANLYEKYKKAGVWDEVKKAALADTFQNPLNDLMRKLYQSTQAHPSLQLLFPFFKTPVNLIGAGMARTPMAAVWAIKKYASGEIDNPEFVQKMVQSAVGTVVMGAAFSAALEGTITGGGPVDPKESELLKRTGWQPYSFKIGDTYYSFQRLEPISTILGMGADIAEAYKRKDIDTASDLMSKLVASASDLVTDKSFVAGWSNAMDILTDPQRKGLSAMRSLQASLVPNTVAMIPFGHAARAIDPEFRETQALTASPFIASIPFLSKTLEPQRSPTGEVRTRTGTAIERLFSPIYRSEVQTGPIAEAAAEITRLGRSLEAPPLYFRAGSDKVYYTPEEREEIARAQERGLMKVADIIAKGGYQNLPDSETSATVGGRTKLDVILSTVNTYRRPALEKANRAAVSRAKAGIE